MKYYRLVRETDSKIIGNVGGIQGFFSGKYPKEQQLLMDKNLYQPIDIHNIQCIELDKKTKMTDVISHGTLTLEGLIVSEKFRTIVEQYQLLDIQFVPIEFHKKKDWTGYSFMFFNSNLTENIDYDATVFGIKKRSMFKGKDTFTPLDKSENNLEALKLLAKKHAGSARYSISVESIYHFKTAMEQDVFRIGIFDEAFYFSEPVVQTILKQNLSGFYFVESRIQS